jgi:hypothetical protein
LADPENRHFILRSDQMKPDHILPAILALAVLTVAVGKLAAQDRELQARCLQKGSEPAECSLRLYGR